MSPTNVRLSSSLPSALWLSRRMAAAARGLLCPAFTQRPGNGIDQGIHQFDVAFLLCFVSSRELCHVHNRCSGVRRDSLGRLSVLIGLDEDHMNMFGLHTRNDLRE